MLWQLAWSCQQLLFQCEPGALLLYLGHVFVETNMAVNYVKVLLLLRTMMVHIMFK